MKTLAQFALAALLAAGALTACSEQATGNAEQTKVAYVASAIRKPFHRPGCQWAARISSANLQTFQTRDEAIRAGHRPCKVCKP